MKLEQAAKLRPRSEAIMQLIQPLAGRLIVLFARYRINPLHVVLSHSLCGFIAAYLIVVGNYPALILAALLLQLKTLLDNVDGGLARATGQVTDMGRYLDTGMDFFVNIALFAVLATHGSALLSFLALVLLTLLLTFDFNAEFLYKGLRQETKHEDVPIGAPMVFYNFFKGVYALLFVPQDRLARGLDSQLFAGASGEEYAAAGLEQRRLWNDLFSTATLVNLGLSTQMFILGVCLVIGQPFLYVTLVFLMSLYTLAVQGLRVVRYRRATQGGQRVP